MNITGEAESQVDIPITDNINGGKWLHWGRGLCSLPAIGRCTTSLKSYTPKAELSPAPTAALALFQMAL